MSKINQCLDLIKKEKIEGSILEFGVFEGWSLSEMVLFCRKNNMTNKIYGFDSFQGMPHNENHWKMGDGASSYENTCSELLKKLNNLDDLTLVQGFFKDSLKKELQGTISKAALIHIDCDLYESASTTLLFCEPLIQSGTFIIFDEYIEPFESRAWREFTKKTGCVFEDYGGIREQGQCVFRIITNKQELI